MKKKIPTGIEEIAAERRTHKRKGFGPRHDDRHRHQGCPALIVNAESCLKSYCSSHVPPRDQWGLARKHHKDPIKLLRIAGALIAAEIDRHNRADRRKTRELTKWLTRKDQ